MATVPCGEWPWGSGHGGEGVNQEQKPRYEMPQRINRAHKVVIVIGLVTTALVSLHALATYAFSTDDCYDDSGDYFFCRDGKKPVERTKTP